MDLDLKISSKDFSKICRICLQTGELKPFLEANLVEIFTILTEFEFAENEQFPKNICILCSNYLEEVVKFAEKCRANTKILSSVLETEEEESKLENLNFHDLELERNCIEDNIFNNEDDGSYLKYESDCDDLSCSVKDENDDEDEKPLKRKRRRKKLVEHSKLHGKKRGRKPKIKIENEDEDEEEKSNSEIPVCKACGTTFASKTKLCSHYKENQSCRPQNFKLFKCEVCDKVRRRNEHMNIHTGETPYICTYCGKGFQLYPAHFKHVYRHRVALGEVELKPGYMEKRIRLNLKCELCPKVFASRSGFANHQLIHQGVKIQYKRRPKTDSDGPKQKNFLCNYCAKSFRTKVQLDAHIRGHTGERPFNCAYCHKGFKTKAALKTHEMNHLGTTPQRFKCETCDKPFSLKAHYEVHKRTHTGEKPFTCHFCGKCFNYRGTWRIHLRIHTGDTPYACPICGMRYHDRSSLNKHQKKKGHEGDAIVQEKLGF